MRKLIVRALLFTPLVLAAGPAISKPQANAQTPITVTGGSETVAQWAARVGHNLNGQLEYPRTIGLQEPHEGIVKVAFRCSGDGRPSDVSIYASSRHSELDRAAIQAVRNMDALPPRPNGVSATARFQAWVVMALSEDSQKKMLASLHKDAELANAAAQADAARTAQADATRTAQAGDQPIILLAAR